MHKRRESKASSGAAVPFKLTNLGMPTAAMAPLAAKGAGTARERVDEFRARHANALTNFGHGTRAS
eukprot:6201645-Pleurochrysis_carterae.AAC.1